ncbi:MAG: glycosyltransferase family 4 protein [Beijerinckiaceae bacterium]|nr:glycosyltransferase family 4 protein [Beijerinckiaceae bacterium]
MRLAIVASHPIQYQAPLFRELSKRLDLDVFFALDPTPEDQGRAGFGAGFSWDVDLVSGYRHQFLKNVATRPGISFAGADTPEVGPLLRNGHYDAVLVLGFYLKTFLQAAWACKRAGVPVMVRGDNHLLEPRSRAKQMIKRVVYPVALRTFDAALYVGQRSRDYFQHYAYPQDRLFFVPHGLDEEAFAAEASPDARARARAELGISQEAKVALFVGKFLARKRAEDLLRASAIALQEGRDVQVLLAGSGPLEDDLKALARTLGVVAHFAGFQNQSRMPSIYAASDLMVLPSDNESWGLVANEALACGKPILLSDAVGAAPDLAQDGMAGGVFPVGDYGALARQMMTLLAYPPPARDIARRSAEYSTAAAIKGLEQACAFVARRGS